VKRRKFEDDEYEEDDDEEYEDDDDEAFVEDTRVTQIITGYSYSL
jgi:hypothetical protein